MNPFNWFKIDRLSDPYLIFAVVVLFIGLSTVVTLALSDKHSSTDVLILTAALVVIVLSVFGGIIVRNISQSGVDKLRTTISTLNARLLAQPISIITKDEYTSVLSKWAAKGPGDVLLFNIELQSFKDSAITNSVWGGLDKLSNIRRVILLLPSNKVRRWEKVVLRERDSFFANGSNHKFYVCDYDPQDCDDHAATTEGIAFALYRLRDGRLDDTAIVFILSQPFSHPRKAVIPEEDDWWDYHHILCFAGDQEVVSHAELIWRQLYAEDRQRSIARVIQDCEPLKPVDPATLFKALGVHERKSQRYLTHFQNRRLVSTDPGRVPRDAEAGSFTLLYDNQDAVQGHYRGVPAVDLGSRPAIIWVGGFTEKANTRLPELFEHTFRRESCIQFFYTVSPLERYITIERYGQDMLNTVQYVASQSGIMCGKPILIARSINGLVAAGVASNPTVLKLLGGIILVAPVFDLIEMMDNYRRATKQPHVTVERCWRQYPSYTADKWECPEHNWLEFFGHRVRLTLLADICRQPADTYGLDGFVRGVGMISQRMPICILSHPNDPITGSARAIDVLKRAASGTGMINSANYRFAEIQSQHHPAGCVDKHQYPWQFKNEVQETRAAMREMFGRLGFALDPADAQGRDLAETIRDS